jgi:hypothetical protein
MNLDDLPADLLRSLITFAPESMGTLALVNKACYDALLGPEVGAGEAHWRAFVTQRRWPAYAHIEAGKYEHKEKTWRDLARGWRDLLPWFYVHVRNPHWASCGELIRQGAPPTRCEQCPCGWLHGDMGPVVYRDAFYRITKLPEPDPDEMIGLQYPAFEVWHGAPSPFQQNYQRFGWNPRRRHILKESGSLDELYPVAAPETDLSTLPKFVCMFIGFV